MTLTPAKTSALVLALLPILCLAQSSATSHDWLTWGGAPDRAGWAKNETILSKDNVAKMELKWMAQLDNPSSDTVLSALTAPLVAENIATAQGRKNLIYVAGSADIVYALDEASGAVVWQKKFPNTLRAPAKRERQLPEYTERDAGHRQGRWNHLCADQRRQASRLKSCRWIRPNGAG